MVESNQLRGMAREPWAWWRSLGSPATVCAPMVDQSERAFRLLVRRHGCDLCYTPMLHADLVVRDAAYRRDHVPDDACAEDRPLIAQLGGGDPATLAAAAREIAARGGCDAIDVNLGCPQACARRGGYGRYASPLNGRRWKTTLRNVTSARGSRSRRRRGGCARWRPTPRRRATFWSAVRRRGPG